MEMNKKGFTLMELLITIAIIAILASVAVTSYVGVTKKAARSEAYSNLENLRLLEEQFFAENACYQPLDAMTGSCPSTAKVIPYKATDTADGGIEDFLTGFKPGGCKGCASPFGLNFTYQIRVENGKGLPSPVPVPYDGSTADLADPNTPCFIVTATGATGSRVDGDVFAIDCNNNKNF